MSIYIQLFILCVTIACSGYLGYLSGIHSKRNASYRTGYGKGYQDGYNRAGVDIPRLDGARALRRQIREHQERVGL